MSVQCETTGRRAAGSRMPFFERYLSVWVAICIVAGIAILRAAPPDQRSGWRCLAAS